MPKILLAHDKNIIDMGLMGASILLVIKTKEDVQSSQPIDLLHQQIDAQMVQTRPSVRTPRIRLHNCRCFQNGGHHSKKTPCKGFKFTYWTLKSVDLINLILEINLSTVHANHKVLQKTNMLAWSYTP
jgi:hypothetical protein